MKRKLVMFATGILLVASLTACQNKPVAEEETWATRDPSVMETTAVVTNTNASETEAPTKKVINNIVVVLKTDAAPKMEGYTYSKISSGWEYVVGDFDSREFGVKGSVLVNEAPKEIRNAVLDKFNGNTETLKLNYQPDGSFETEQLALQLSTIEGYQAYVCEQLVIVRDDNRLLFVTKRGTAEANLEEFASELVPQMKQFLN